MLLYWARKFALHKLLVNDLNLTIFKNIIYMTSELKRFTPISTTIYSYISKSIAITHKSCINFRLSAEYHIMMVLWMCRIRIMNVDIRKSSLDDMH